MFSNKKNQSKNKKPKANQQNSSQASTTEKAAEHETKAAAVFNTNEPFQFLSDEELEKLASKGFKKLTVEGLEQLTAEELLPVRSTIPPEETFPASMLEKAAAEHKSKAMVSSMKHPLYTISGNQINVHYEKMTEEQKKAFNAVVESFDISKSADSKTSQEEKTTTINKIESLADLISTIHAIYERPGNHLHQKTFYAMFSEYFIELFKKRAFEDADSHAEFGIMQMATLQKDRIPHFLGELNTIRMWITLLQGDKNTAVSIIASHMKQGQTGGDADKIFRIDDECFYYMELCRCLYPDFESESSASDTRKVDLLYVELMTIALSKQLLTYKFKNLEGNLPLLESCLKSAAEILESYKQIKKKLLELSHSSNEEVIDRSLNTQILKATELYVGIWQVYTPLLKITEQPPTQIFSYLDEAIILAKEIGLTNHSAFFHKGKGDIHFLLYVRNSDTEQLMLAKKTFQEASHQYHSSCAQLRLIQIKLLEIDEKSYDSIIKNRMLFTKEFNQLRSSSIMLAAEDSRNPNTLTMGLLIIYKILTIFQAILTKAVQNNDITYAKYINTGIYLNIAYIIEKYLNTGTVNKHIFDMLFSMIEFRAQQATSTENNKILQTDVDYLKALVILGRENTVVLEYYTQRFNIEPSKHLLRPKTQTRDAMELLAALPQTLTKELNKFEKIFTDTNKHTIQNEQKISEEQKKLTEKRAAKEQERQAQQDAIKARAAEVKAKDDAIKIIANTKLEEAKKAVLAGANETAIECFNVAFAEWSNLSKSGKNDNELRNQKVNAAHQLAICYSEVEDFKNAVATAQRGIDIAGNIASLENLKNTLVTLQQSYIESYNKKPSNIEEKSQASSIRSESALTEYSSATFAKIETQAQSSSTVQQSDNKEHGQAEKLQPAKANVKAPLHTENKADTEIKLNAQDNTKTEVKVNDPVAKAVKAKSELKSSSSSASVNLALTTSSATQSSSSLSTVVPAPLQQNNKAHSSTSETKATKPKRDLSGLSAYTREYILGDTSIADKIRKLNLTKEERPLFEQFEDPYTADYMDRAVILYDIICDYDSLIKMSKQVSLDPNIRQHPTLRIEYNLIEIQPMRDILNKLLPAAIKALNEQRELLAATNASAEPTATNAKPAAPNESTAPNVDETTHISNTDSSGFFAYYK